MGRGFLTVIFLLSQPGFSFVGHVHRSRGLPVVRALEDHNLFSISLNFTEASDRNPHLFSKTVMDVWRWKDAVLGDGRDFFVPKPKTLEALNRVVSTPSKTSEALILSNCARFEVLLVTEDQDPTKVVSDLLVTQMEFYENRRLRWNPPGDWPGAIDQNAPYRNPDRSKELSQYWEVRRGFDEVARHWANVAAGLASRPRRPNRPVIFRPFSSRDAHILLQLKRTLEIHSSSRSKKDGSILSLVLQTALAAGKASRNPDQVPELEALRAYGSGNSKIDQSVAPQRLMQSVIAAVHEKAIEPSVRDGVSKLQARSQANAITNLRQKAERLATNPDELAFVRRALHQPTMKLRNAENINVDRFLEELEEKVSQSRHASAS